MLLTKYWEARERSKHILLLFITTLIHSQDTLYPIQHTQKPYLHPPIPATPFPQGIDRVIKYNYIIDDITIIYNMPL